MPRARRRRTHTRDTLSPYRKTRSNVEEAPEKAPETDHARCRLLELPSEMLHHVLDYCFSSLYTSLLPSCTREEHLKCVHQSLLLTCRTFRDMSFDRYARTHIITFKEPTSFSRLFRAHLTPPVTQPLRYINMELQKSDYWSRFGVGISQFDGLIGLLDKLKRLVSFTNRYSELRHLEQPEIRLTMRRVTDCEVIHHNAVKIVENLISHHENNGQTAYFFIRESYRPQVVWVSFHKVSEDVWEKIPHEVVEKDLDCDSGCGGQGAHICRARKSKLVRSCEDIISQVQEQGYYPDSTFGGSLKTNRAMTWKAIRERPDKLDF